MNIQNYTQEENFKTTWVLAKLNLSNRTQNPANRSHTHLPVSLPGCALWSSRLLAPESEDLETSDSTPLASAQAGVGSLTEKHMESSLAGRLWCHTENC